MTCQTSIIPQAQPPGFKESTKLYKYQLDALSWMKAVEEDINAGKTVVSVHHQKGMTYKYCPLIPWRAAKTGLLFDFSNVDSPRLVTCDEIPKHVKSFQPKGAVLADEVGLGKTLESNNDDIITK